MPVYDLDKLNESIEPFRLVISSSILEDAFVTSKANTPMDTTIIIYPKDGVNIPHFHIQRLEDLIPIGIKTSVYLDLVSPMLSKEERMLLYE